MYINVVVNGASNIKIAYVSVSELRTIERNIIAKAAEVDTILAEVIAEGDAQILRIENEGGVQIGLIQDEGVIQLGLVTTEGDTQVARVILEGDIQVARATTEADRAETAADEIKDVGVVSPVTSVPLLPGNEPGIPTVTYDPITGLFTYGIPIGKTGEPASVVTPQGGATVAELNALVADPAIGSAWWMEDSGTITYGDPDTPVLVDEIVVWVAEGYFFNMGILAAGTTWQLITDVTVEGFAPVNGDNLARVGTSYTKAEQDAIDLAQQNAIDLNTAKVGITPTQSDAIDLNTAKVGITTAQSDAIVLNTAKVTGADRILAGDVVLIDRLTQAEYDALTPVTTTLYIIIG